VNDTHSPIEFIRHHPALLESVAVIVALLVAAIVPATSRALF
jgi:hypothetical protein